jgi:hypothetical protein
MSADSDDDRERRGTGVVSVPAPRTGHACWPYFTAACFLCASVIVQ